MVGNTGSSSSGLVTPGYNIYLFSVRKNRNEDMNQTMLFAA